MAVVTMRVRDVMTADPLTVEARASVAQAHVLMRRRNIRHLPVVDCGVLVGLLSERDVFLLLSLSGTDAEQEPVEEAMTEVPYTVSPDDELGPVLRAMAESKYGSAVVVDGARVVGVLTTVDALRGLAHLLEGAE